MLRLNHFQYSCPRPTNRSEESLLNPALVRAIGELHHFGVFAIQLLTFMMEERRPSLRQFLLTTEKAPCLRTHLKTCRGLIKGN